MKTIGERIREIRKEKRISQTELAKKMDISTQVMYGIEKNISNPTPEHLIKLSHFLEKSTDYLLTGKEEANKIKIEENTISTTEKEIIQLVRNDLDIKKTLVQILETKKKAIQKMLMTTQNHELMAA